MEGDQFSLCWSNFNDNLSSGLHTLMQDQNMVDVTIATAQGRQIKAHKIVLAVASPYFKDVFAANPCKHPIIILPHVEYNIIQSLIHFMYVGEVHVAQEDIGKFMSLAEFLKVKGLTDNANEFESNGVEPSVMRQNVAKRPRTMRKMLHPTHYRAIAPKEEPRSPTASPLQSPVAQMFGPLTRPIAVPISRAGPSTSQSQTVVNPAAMPSPKEGNLSSAPQHVNYVPITPVGVVPKNENHSFIQPKQEPIDHDDNTSNSGGEIDISQVLDPQLLNTRPSSANSVHPVWPVSNMGAPSASPGTLQCILGRRGNPRLIVDGHVFYKKSVYKGKAFWYCKSSRTPEKCPSVCWTMNGNIVKWPGVHSHPVIPDVFNPEEDTEVPIENLQEVLWQTSF